MAKSIYAVAGLGFGSCLLLSLMMQHLLKVKKDLVRPSFVMELEELLAGRLDGPVDVKREKVGDRERMTLFLTVADHADKQRVARVASPIAWRQLAGGPNDPDVLVFALARKGEATPVEIEAERPPWVPAKSRGTPVVRVAPAQGSGTSPKPAGR